MRNSPKQYAAHLMSQDRQLPYLARMGQQDVTGVRSAPITRRPPAPEVSPAGLRDLAAEMRADASRWLARANDLEAAAKRLEDE